MKTDSGAQQPDILDSPEQTKHNDFQSTLKKNKRIQT